jgi:hypothetical protein
MSYFIFLKYLKSLEEFRKNPCVQIPPKSPCANFQSLVIFKNSIFTRKEIFFNFWPNRPSGQPAHPAFWPRAAKQTMPAHQAAPRPPPFPFLPPSPSRRLHRLPLSCRCAMGAALPLSRAMERPQRMPPSLTRPRAFTQS